MSPGQARWNDAYRAYCYAHDVFCLDPTGENRRARAEAKKRKTEALMAWIRDYPEDHHVLTTSRS